MRLEWLEDILAVVETGSFNAAAARRNVTQPAFSRRIRAIEDYVGAELFDRDRKPVGLKPSISAQQEEIKRLVSEMKDLLYELRRQGREANNRIVIASQHAITTSRAPGIIEAFSNTIDVSVRLRSANRDECLALLMTKQADLLLNYQSVAAASFTLVLGSMRYSGLLHQMAVQHEPGDPDVKPLDVQTFPVEWPANLPASLNMRVYSVVGMGIIMLASNPIQ